MGIAIFLKSALKGVAWGKVAGFAMEYGPELCRRISEHLRGDGHTGDEQEENGLQQRVDRLEKLLLEQEEIIREQVLKNEKLQDACTRLETRLSRLRIVSIILAVTAGILAVMLLRQL